MRKDSLCLALLLAMFFNGIAPSQDLKTERGINQALLKVLKSDIEDKYFDTGSHTSMLDSRFKEAYDLIGRSSSTNEMARITALFVIALNDPRIFFLPRNTNVQVNYQWSLELIGDSAYVADLDAKSDAYAKGIRRGDRIYMLEGYILSRENFWKVKTLLEIQSPQDSLDAIVVKPNGRKYEIKFNAKVAVSNVLEDFTLTQNRNRLLPDETDYEEKAKPKFYDQIPGLLICRFGSFLVEPISVEKLLDKAHNNEALILDLRGAGGISAKAWELRIRLDRETVAYFPEEWGQNIDQDDGDLNTLQFLVSGIFHPRQSIGEIRGKKGTEKLMAKAAINSQFSGKLVVLVDSETAGAAEIFARFVQLEKRGTIIGDVTSGRSVKTKFLSHSSWETFGSPFGMQVPVAEITLNGGDRINEKGVIPDQLILPTQSDLAMQKDSAMERAAELLGFKLSPGEARKLFVVGK